MRRRSSPGEVNLWPAFTDVLGSVLVVLVFLVTIFIINETLIGHEVANKKTAIEQLGGITDYLDSLLGEANRDNEALRAQVHRLQTRIDEQGSELSRLRTRVASLSDERARMDVELDSRARRLSELDVALASAREEGEQLEGWLAQREADYERLEAARSADRAKLQQTRASAEVLASRVQRLAGELERLNGALSAGRTELKAAEGRIEDLSSQLAAREKTIDSQRGRIEQMDRLIKRQLVERVEELERYASDFFGRLREVFADNPDIKVVGDRFVFQSEVLFPSAAAVLSESGKSDLEQFVGVYRQLANQIPDDLPVIIEVQGHTDRVPINTRRFASNWELSTARALNVVEFLIGRGVPPERLAAVGMGEYHPIDEGASAEALRRNRRIELKITSR